MHVNTGVGVEETRAFVRATSTAYGWNLREMHPTPFTPGPGKRREGIDYENLPAYEALVMHYGFPGPKRHTLIYNRVKERCIRGLERESVPAVCRHCGRLRRGHGGPTQKKVRVDHAFDRGVIMLVTGVRRQESKRRMGHIVAVQREGPRRLWVALMVNWDSDQKNAYIEKHGLPRNPVVKNLCMSGECACGAYARPGELSEISFYYPKTAQYIRELEARVRAPGTVKRCTWGEKPLPKPGKRKTVKEVPGQGHLGLCFSCESKHQVESERLSHAPVHEGELGKTS